MTYKWSQYLLDLLFSCGVKQRYQIEKFAYFFLTQKKIGLVRAGTWIFNNPWRQRTSIQVPEKCCGVEMREGASRGWLRKPQTIGLDRCRVVWVALSEYPTHHCRGDLAQQGKTAARQWNTHSALLRNVSFGNWMSSWSRGSQSFSAFWCSVLFWSWTHPAPKWLLHHSKVC